MKAELTKDECVKISPETVAEAIALRCLFIKEREPEEWFKKIIICSGIDQST